MKRILCAVMLLSVLLTCTLTVRGQDGYGSITEKYEKYKTGSDTDMTVTEFLTGENDTDTHTDSEISDFYSELPDDIKALMPKGAEEDMGANKFDLKWILGIITDSIKKGVRTVGKTFGILLCVTVLSYLLKISLYTNNSSVSKIAECIIVSVCFIIVYKSGLFGFESTETYLNTFEKLGESVLSVTVTMMIMSGKLNSACTAGTVIMSICTVTEILFTKIIVPFISVSLAFTVSSVFDNGIAAKLSGLFRKLAIWSTTLICTALTFISGFQTVLANKTDSLSIRTAKFALGSMIPVVGGALSDTYGTLSAGIGYISGAVGIIGIAAVCALILPVLCKLIISKISVNVISAFSESINSDKLTFLFREISADYDCFIAITCISSGLLIMFICGFLMSAG